VPTLGAVEELFFIGPARTPVSGGSGDRDAARRQVPFSLLRPEQIRRGQAADLAAARAARDLALRQKMELSALELSGEVGYGSMTVERIVAASGSHLPRFYGEFANKAACYAAAHSTALDELSERILLAGARAPDWAAGVHAGLLEIARITRAEPLLAKGLIVEAPVAGGGAATKRMLVLARLGRALDRARAELDSPLPPPPPSTAFFLVSGVEASVIASLRSGSDFEASVADLTYLLVCSYFDVRAAKAALRRLG
jgi:AcrR family transcriptional regulator